MNILYGLLIFAYAAGIGWILGRNRGRNDQISIKCDDCAIHMRYGKALVEIRELRDLLHGAKSSNGKLAKELQGMSFRNSGYNAR